MGADGKKQIKTASQPSRAQIGRLNVSIGGLGSSGVYEINDTFYTVGSDVPSPEAMRDASYAHSELNNVLISNSLITSGLSGVDVRLSTGLPLKQYFTSEASMNTDVINKVKGSLKPLAAPVDITEAKIVDHLVYAESLAAYVDWFLDDDGNKKNHVNYGVVVVDVGGGTTDISSITANNQINIEASGTKRIGILDVFRKLRALLASNYGIDEEFIRDDMLDEAIRTCTFTLRGKPINCSKEVVKAKQFVASRLKTFINELVLDTADHIIFVGGGAEALKDQLLNLEGYGEGFVIIPEEPQFANVRGMLKFMTYVHPQNQQK